MNSLDPWRVTQSSPPSDVMVVPPSYYGHPFIDGRAGIFIGAETLLPRSNLTAVLAPVLAPATGGFTARVELDHQQQLHAAICVDGKCYQTSIDLAPAIAAVMAKIALAHADMHASMAHAPVISGDVAIGAVDEAVSAAGDALIGALIDRHISVACAGWLDDVGSAVASTVRKFKGPITAVAAKVAESYGGPAAGAAASQLVGPVIDGVAGKDTPQKAVAEQAAQTDPAAATALSTAKDAVAHTVAAYHVTETAKQAAAGHPAAQKEIAAVVQDAEKGDPVAHAATDLIANAFSTAIAARKHAAPAVAPVAYRPAPITYQMAPAAPVTYQTAPAEYRHPATYQQTASRAVARAQHKRQQQNFRPVPAFGYLRHDKRHKVYFFNSPGEAENWYAALAPGYSYAALFDAQNLAAPLAENFGGAGPAVSGW
jgi:hypothetical protein